jgi:hypothetical protein
MDGQPLGDREALNILMAAKRWSDRATFVVSRDGKDEKLTAVFRRELMEDSPAAATPKDAEGPSARP